MPAPACFFPAAVPRRHDSTDSHHLFQNEAGFMSLQHRVGWAPSAALVFCVEVSTALVGCGGNDARVTGGEPAGPDGPSYAVGVSVYNPDASQTYLLTTQD